MTEDTPRSDPTPPKMYGVFDQYGRSLGFYPDDIYPPTEDGARNAGIPTDAVEISIEDWQTYLSNQPFAAYIDGAVVIGETPVVSALAETPPSEPNPTERALADIAERLAKLEKKRR
jgi:hypothetical protein